MNMFSQYAVVDHSGGLSWMLIFKNTSKFSGAIMNTKVPIEYALKTAFKYLYIMSQ